jgi:succinate dehydrogenase hydrophobic anchor subunit
MASDVLPDTFKIGMIFAVSGVFLLFTVLLVVECIFEWHDWPSIGFRLESWSRQNPWFAAVLLVAFGALLAHFVLSPWPPA